jgi:pantothenate kinase
MDGYHLTRAQLDQFPDPLHAHAKRGAHWTFDPLALGRKLCEISRSKADTVTVHAFDHAAKDPHFDAIAVPAAARVVIVEGLYLLLTLSPWCEAVAPWFSLRVLLECPAAVCRARGARRNYAAGICASLAASEARWDDSDNRNGALLLEHLDRTALDAVLTQEDAQQLLFPPADSAAASGVGAAGADPGAAGGNAGSGSDV